MDKSDLSEIKKQFMVYRNGIVADTLRKAGMNYHVIFGLQLPQISAIARQLQVDNVLAIELWNDKSVRESRLLACYLFDALSLSIEDAEKLALDVQTREEADILAFRLLRHLPFAQDLADRLSSAHSPMAKYAEEALRRNLASM